MSELINVILIRLNYKLIIFSGCADNHNINTMYSISQSHVCTCDCGLWSIPYRACSLQFSFIEQALTSVSAVFWLLLSEIQEEVEIKFLCQVVETFNWPLRSNIDIVHKTRVFYDSIELKHWTFQCSKSVI